jgi:phage tail sheath protein FI
MSGYAAAVYARTDSAAQPWIAPAGLNRGQITNIVDLAFNPNQKQRDFLYTISINPVVLFSGDGYTIFGQKTLQNKPSAFDRVNVRRLFLTLERATQQALRYFVFEPNTEFTRTRLKNTIAPIFELAKNTEGLYEYLIVCDERNNTPDVIDRNELAVDIYIKPVKAAEFILVNFIATRTGQNFQELI